jgi:hypothetical protein
VQLRHAQGFATVARALDLARAPRLLDLGSGGGLPGLVVAAGWPEASTTLLDANGRRTEFLRRAVERLGIGGHTRVVQARAEEVGRDLEFRAGFDVVLARSFGRPAVVAECAAPLLVQGGWLVVSEPPAPAAGPAKTTVVAGGQSGAEPEIEPGGQSGAEPEIEPGGQSGAEPEIEPGGSPGRWPKEGLVLLGLEAAGTVRTEFEYQVLRLSTPCPDRFPRRNGVPAKRPLF